MFLVSINLNFPNLMARTTPWRPLRAVLPGPKDRQQWPCLAGNLPSHRWGARLVLPLRAAVGTAGIGTRSRSSVMVNSVLPYATILSVRPGVCCKPPRWRCTNPNFSRLLAASLNHLPIASRLSSPRPGSAMTSPSTTSSKSPIFRRPWVLLVHECKVVKHDGQAQGPQLSPTSATWR